MPDADGRPLVSVEEELLRRCPPAVPDFVTARDLITGEVKMTRGALQLKKDEDGISVYQKNLLEREGKSAVDVQKKADRFVFVFPAAVVYQAGWITAHDVDETDAETGFAHALIKLLEMPPPGSSVDKAMLNQLRALVIGAARAIVSPAA